MSPFKPFNPKFTSQIHFQFVTLPSRTLFKFLMKNRIEHKSKFLGIALSTLGVDNPDKITNLYNAFIQESSTIYRKISFEEDSSSEESSDDMSDGSNSQTSVNSQNSVPVSKNRFAAFDLNI